MFKLEHIRWLMRQPLEQLNIAKPFSRIAMNANNVGYAMEFMGDLISLESLMNDTEESIASEGTPEQYLASGGLKRRMKLLANNFIRRFSPPDARYCSGVPSEAIDSSVSFISDSNEIKSPMNSIA